MGRDQQRFVHAVLMARWENVLQSPRAKLQVMEGRMCALERCAGKDAGADAEKVQAVPREHISKHVAKQVNAALEAQVHEKIGEVVKLVLWKSGVRIHE